MSDTTKMIAVIVLGVVAVVGILVYGISHYERNRPAEDRCKDACGYNLVLSYTPQEGCVCR